MGSKMTASVSVDELREMVSPGDKVTYLRRGQRGRPAKTYGTFQRFNQNGTVRVKTLKGIKTLDVVRDNVTFYVA